MKDALDRPLRASGKRPRRRLRETEAACRSARTSRSG